MPSSFQCGQEAHIQALHRLAISVAVLFALPPLASAQARDTGFEIEPGTTVLPPIRFEQLSIASAAETIADDDKSRSTQKHGKDVVSATVEVKSAGKLVPVYKSYQANQ